MAVYFRNKKLRPDLATRVAIWSLALAISVVFTFVVLVPLLTWILGG